MAIAAQKQPVREQGLTQVENLARDIFARLAGQEYHAITVDHLAVHALGAAETFFKVLKRSREDAGQE